MADPIYLEGAGHRAVIKWHRARRNAGDPVFTGARILEGMRLGASIEVDLVIHRDRGFAVLHDDTLDRETTGRGPVAEASGQALRQLFLRDNDGKPIDQHVMLLEDLSELLDGGDIHPEALLQLDYKLDAPALDEAAIASFRRSTQPLARQMILSSGDAEAVRMLAEAVDGLKVGYDPCDGPVFDRLQATRDYAAFVAEAVAASPRAEMIYLDYRLVLSAADSGYDLIGAFHAAGRRVDAWTIQRIDAASSLEVDRLMAMKVDQITTDDPEGLAALA